MFYADDTQLYVSISPRDINNSNYLATLNSCLSAITTWMGNNMLKLNDGKTERYFWVPLTSLRKTK